MAAESPLISVIMPVFNAERYVAAAIDSILSQTFSDFEFIIINDASTDKSAEIIESYAKIDLRIIYLKNEKNLNIARSRNRGVAIAKGKYVVTMDADDIAMPNRLQDQFDFLETHPDISVSIGNINVIDETGVFQYQRKYPETDLELRKKVFRYNPFPNPTIMCRSELYKSVGNYDNYYVPIDDFDFWLRVGVNHKFGNSNKTVLNYRIVSNSASHGKIRLTERITFILRWKALKMGYKFGLGDIVFNAIHLLSYALLPSKLKVKMFNIIRKYKLF